MKRKDHYSEICAQISSVHFKKNFTNYVNWYAYKYMSDYNQTFLGIQFNASFRESSQ